MEVTPYQRQESVKVAAGLRHEADGGRTLNLLQIWDLPGLIKNYITGEILLERNAPR
jgi:hypothetical protein